MSKFLLKHKLTIYIVLTAGLMYLLVFVLNLPYVPAAILQLVGGLSLLWGFDYLDMRVKKKAKGNDDHH